MMLEAKNRLLAYTDEVDPKHPMVAFLKAQGLESLVHLTSITETRDREDECLFDDYCVELRSRGVAPKVAALVSKQFGKARTVVNRYTCWAVPGKGLIVLDVSRYGGELQVIRAQSERQLAYTIEYFLESREDISLKFYEADVKTRTIIARPYDGEDNAKMKALLPAFAKAFGLSGWKVKLQSGWRSSED